MKKENPAAKAGGGGAATAAAVPAAAAGGGATPTGAGGGSATPGPGSTGVTTPGSDTPPSVGSCGGGVGTPGPPVKSADLIAASTPTGGGGGQQAPDLPNPPSNHSHASGAATPTHSTSSQQQQSGVKSEPGPPGGGSGVVNGSDTPICDSNATPGAESSANTPPAEVATPGGGAVTPGPAAAEQANNSVGSVAGAEDSKPPNLGDANTPNNCATPNSGANNSSSGLPPEADFLENFDTKKEGEDFETVLKVQGDF